MTLESFILLIITRKNIIIIAFNSYILPVASVFKYSKATKGIIWSRFRRRLKQQTSTSKNNLAIKNLKLTLKIIVGSYTKFVEVIPLEQTITVVYF